ncbi:MAG: long-chain fatty acid--CoA ligase [Candidatus Acidiferrales bacterium]
MARPAMEYPTLTKLFLDAADKFANPRAQMWRTDAGWQSIPAREMLRRVAGFSKALAQLGIQAGDRVALLAPNCPEWHITDFAVLGLGGVNVPIYFNESVERIVYILNDSGARLVITAGAAQAQKISECRTRAGAIEQVICVAPPAELKGDVLNYETLIASAGDEDIAEYRSRAAGVASSQLATIIYTSGTTGEPKGVMLSHSNLASNAIDSCAGLEYRTDDVALSFLPLAHVYERVDGYVHLSKGVSIAYLEQIESVPEALLEVRPTVAAAVPRFFEKMYAGILDKGRRAHGVRRKLFEWSLRVASRALPWRAYGAPAPLALRWQWNVANRVVYSKIREGLGGRIRLFISGGAPLAKELAEFFWSIGVPVYQGYGLTETSPVVAVNTPLANRVGTVGRPIPHVEIKIADDGEILVKGPCVMQGYYRKPAETREVFTLDGWFCTGDVGHLDADGYLLITDRKKELLKTAGGKFVAPAPIENLLKSSRFISNALVVGDKHKFVSVLVVPNFSAIETEAVKLGRDPLTQRQALADPWVRELLSAEIERATAALAQYEKPKRFALIEKDFTYGGGELTYTMKVRRRVIEEHYRDVIERLYADVEDPRPQPRS